MDATLTGERNMLEAVPEVLCWRFEQLRLAGFDRAEAIVIAADRRIDLHRATDLVQRGCPSKLALRILL